MIEDTRGLSRMLEEVRRLKAQSEPAAVLHEEQQQALEEARMFHMLREDVHISLGSNILNQILSKFFRRS